MKLERTKPPKSNWSLTFLTLIKHIKLYYLIYFSMNFLWNSDRSVSFTNLLSFFWSSIPFAQFLKTTSSSHLKGRKENKPLTTPSGGKKTRGCKAGSAQTAKEQACLWWEVRVAGTHTQSTHHSSSGSRHTYCAQVKVWYFSGLKARGRTTVLTQTSLDSKLCVYWCFVRFCTNF